MPDRTPFGSASSDAAASLVVCFFVLACGQHGGDTQSAGGASGHAANGGENAVGGGGAPANGGAPQSAGGAPQSAGGAAANGGASANGGAPANGDGGAFARGGQAETSGGRTGEPAAGGVSAGGNAGVVGSSGTSSSAGATTGSGGRAAGAAGAAGLAGNGGSSSACPRYDASSPPTMLTLSGDLGTHDPSLIAADDQYYLFQTGSRLPTKTSKDLLTWQAGSPVFSANPGWIATAVPGATDLWAPDISYFGGSYHLYYAASTFGSNTSCIGHATRASLASGTWTDQGSVVCSASADAWNAIDPNVIVDDAGTPWLAFGSFWGGIKLVKLDATGARADAELNAVAARPNAGGALEGATIVHVCGYYYLFTSWDHCCDSPWNYNIRVGRAASVLGPYADQAGTARSCKAAARCSSRATTPGRRPGTTPC
jgi:arabinan endo-1,5-alpha-L-arabinosidase